ncbi:MAG: alpha/beta fold hydrolase [Candidatus Omnitrophica bacterium]|nr:alpha/beta fold hydrolase [Candidatus Omnitrophota bacterium]
MFKQLKEQICDKIEDEDKTEINRFHVGSLSDPNRWSQNWNRTFEFKVEKPRGGILLLHGLSDAPYSLRSIGERLRDEGFWVVGLRIPGHGTAPSGLTQTKWEDMTAAVRIGMQHLKENLGDKPLFVVGYSNGGALGVHYVLSTLEDESLPKVKGLILISPEIGVTPVAALAVWQARIGHLLGLPKVEWSGLLPEYDPYKYGSFAVNAGDLAYRLTKEIHHRIEELRSKGLIEKLPPILAFQSAVDGTVSTRALVEELFARLSPGGHELVVFDINRLGEVARIFSKDPAEGIQMIMGHAELPFAFSLVTNEGVESSRVIVRYKREGTTEVVENPLDLSWPPKVYSLSHVALPFSAEDPLYGVQKSEENRGIFLGDIALRGEKGVLKIPASEMLRLRHNPFHSYLMDRLLQFVQEKS